MVERISEKDEVVGSLPTSGTIPGLPDQSPAPSLAANLSLAPAYKARVAPCHRGAFILPAHRRLPAPLHKGEKVLWEGAPWRNAVLLNPNEEVHFVRRELATVREHGVYNLDKWHVSGLNRNALALGRTPAHALPTRVTLTDITLRTAEQTPGVSLHNGQRRRLARALVLAGVRSIMVAMVDWGLSGDVIREDIAYIKGLNPDVEIVMGGGDTIEAIDWQASLGANLVHIVMPSNVAMSAFYVGAALKLSWQGRDWRREANSPKTLGEAFERNQVLIDRAHKRGMKAAASLAMLMYADEETIRQYALAMGAAGADYVCLGDGCGGNGPEAIGYIVSLIKQTDPRLGVIAHMHNVFNLGVANSIAAMRAGADALECSVNGYCAATGQADLAHLAATLEVLYGVDTGIKLEKLTDLRRLGEDLTGVRVGRAHPITGDEAFTWNGADWLTNEIPVDGLLHWCIDPDVVGNRRRWNIDRTSGPWAMLDKLRELGIEVDSKEDVEAVLAAAREELLVRRRSLTDQEIRGLATAVIGVRQ